jgi:hypothetical protein
VLPHSRCRLILELDLDAEPIGGVLVDDRGQGQPFSGWMALTRTIELGLGAARGSRASGPGAVDGSASRPPADPG